MITTPAGTQFVDADRLADLTGHPVPADAFVVAPATFNTINKWANGISDTLALGLLNEGLAAGQPIAAVPNPNITLAKHPAFARSVAFLRENGVRVLFEPDAYPLPNPQSRRGEPGPVSLGGAEGRSRRHPGGRTLTLRVPACDASANPRPAGASSCLVPCAALNRGPSTNRRWAIGAVIAAAAAASAIVTAVTTIIIHVH